MDWKTLGAIAAAGAWVGRQVTRPRYALRGKVVLLTGGSRGLGLELARVFARRGARLALLARDDEELARARDELRAGGAEVEIFGCDVRFQDQVQRTVREVLERFGRVDVLINNAGIIQVGPRGDDARLRLPGGDGYALLRTAVPGRRRCCPGCGERREGRIVNISSVGGKVPTPHLLPYVASKFALVGWSEGLHAELRQDGIVVTTVCPGLMRTGSPRHVAVKGRSPGRVRLVQGARLAPLRLDERRGRRRGPSSAVSSSGRPSSSSPGARGPGPGSTGLAPGLLSELLAVGARLLPRARSPEDFERWSGAESESALTRSFVTGLTQRAEVENNERPSPAT